MLEPTTLALLLLGGFFLLLPAGLVGKVVVRHAGLLVALDVQPVAGFWGSGLGGFARRRGADPVEHDLEVGVVAGLRRGLQFCDQLRERQVDVALGIQRLLFDGGQ